MDDPPSALPHPRPRPRSARRLRLTERDLELLRFVAEQRVVRAAQVQQLLGITIFAATTRLRALTEARYLESERVLERGPTSYVATRRGMDAVGVSYRKAAVQLGSYEHDIGLGWLWLAAHRGLWGEMREVVSERAMRSADARDEGAGAPYEEQRRSQYGVRLGGYGASGRRSLHYPDLLMVAPDGRRIAVELELTRKSRARINKIIGGYASDLRIDAVVYLVEDRGEGVAIARMVEQAARSRGISHMVHLQRFRRQAEGDTRTAPTRDASRAADTGPWARTTGDRRAGAAPRARATGERGAGAAPRARATGERGAER